MKHKDTVKQPTDIDRYVGTQVRAARRELKLTQDDLGQLLNITFQQVQKYERGVNRISSGKLYEIAVTLKRPIDFFYPDQTHVVDQDDSRTTRLKGKDTKKDIVKCITNIDDGDVEYLQTILAVSLSVAYLASA